MIRALRTCIQRLNSCNSNFGISTSSLAAEADLLFECNNLNQRSQTLPSSLTIPLYKLIDRYKRSRSPTPASLRHKEPLSNPFPSSETHYEDLARQYAGSSDPKDAKRLHLQIIKVGLVGNLFLPNTLITLYARMGNLVAAHDLFDEMPERNVVTWNCLISGYVQQGMSNEACRLFRSMLCAGFVPTHYELGNALRACQDSGPRGLHFGMQLHALILKSQYALDVVVCNGLISMYGSCCLDFAVYAHRVFDEMQLKNSISWNSIISVYSQRGDAFSAFWLFSAMQREGLGVSFKPSEYTFGSLITTAYSTSSDSGLFLLEQILNRVTKSGFLSDLYVGSALVSGFARFGLLDNAKKIFKQMSERNAVSMNGLMVGLVRQKRGEEAAQVFCEASDLVGINCDSYVILLSACAEFKVPKEGRRKGREVHAYVLRTGLNDIKVAIANGLVNMYAKCGAIADAFRVFKLMGVKDLVSWNSIISGLDQNRCFREAVGSFYEMRRSGLIPSNFTLISTLSSCASLGCTQLGAQIHSEGIKLGLDLDVSVSNSLLGLYAETGYVTDCQKVFSLMPDYDQVSWNSMIGAFADSDASISGAIEYFLDMMRAGWSPNRVTFINILAAVSSLSIHELCQQVHALALKYCVADDTAIENAFLSCYGKCGEMDDCGKIFSSMSERRDEVSWNSMIAGYIHNGFLSKAMDLVWLMMQRGQRLDCFTFATVLSACASVAALERGKEIHACGIRACLETDIVVGSALVDMYAKCGRIDYASNAFQLMPMKNEFSWNSMISGYARHGCGVKALQLFTEMLQEGQPPDHVTFVGVLSACSHVGLVDEGLWHFESMSNKYGLVPRMEHYSCMVDLLGRAGQLTMVEEFVRRMPMRPNILMWRTILGACCRANGANTELGRHAAEMLLALEPQNAVNYVLVSNMFAFGGRWDDVAKARAAMREASVKKEAGCSWVTMKDGVHVFVAGDKLHPDTEKIYEKLWELNRKMRDLGYVPQTKFALYDLEVESKEELLSCHSEKLAVAFVLTRTSALPVRIMKNLRVCGDCHSAFRYISKIVGRQIILRDSNRFHHFIDGKCSCGDYW
ncbi:putative pentatricopeptide repeat-containing protein At5g09950 [Telopea speciosissima]|uniref:putative pentatricopeptide repeat-containing protein At5g09950 n=1 Tax=Telopea speciosissima TaxID=54955 RepID=UPI001CC62E7D|nr:putative pentatricopeptide repeat-containing protein At5g09950 [Telopea speciosissima]